MKDKKYIRFLQVGWISLLLLLLLALMVTPVSANSTSVPGNTQQNPATSVAANIYITLGTLQPLFQSNINNMVPGAVNNAINGIVGSLPQKDRSWAQIMATTLFQPSATLTGLTKQSNGLVASLQLSLYQGDPHPINASLLTTFSVASASSISVTAKPVSGSPTLVNGPISTFQIPFGQLHSIQTTAACGDAALNVGLQFPISLAQGQTQTQTQPSGLNAPVSPMALQQRNLVEKNSDPATNQNSYVEIPATSIASIGNSIGSFPVNSSQTAKNIQVSVQGNQIVVTSDIYDSFWGHIGSAVTTMAPTTSNGNIAVKVLSTTFKLFGFISIPYDSYDQSIQQSLNTKLQGALAGKFNATHAQIGPNPQIPCAASNSLLLTGTVSLG
ncbi:MAG TPA: hypothetical protein VKU38_07700 [Ktedonobacteraceae bacterium]|nr:hypothetical protein [Ktedonobacteraceae bacterium]